MSNYSLTSLLYNGIGYPVLSVGAHVAAVFSPKLREGLRGRHLLQGHVREFRLRNPDARVVLFHCASAGELEGVKPLAAACRARGYLPCVTFFSPSALTVLGENEFSFADYSPFDSRRAVREFLQALRPEAVMISKHDVWPNLVWQSGNLGVSVWLINGNFHEGSLKSWPLLRGIHRSIYSKLKGILTVSETDAQRARHIVGSECFVDAVGDSRFDRVWWRAQMGRAPFPELDTGLRNRAFVVCGSTHERDEEILLSSLNNIRKQHPSLQMLVVPHDPSDAALQRIQTRAEECGLSHSEIRGNCCEADVLIVNEKGVLADLYRYGKLAYVGGGFGRGVHSVLEPMAHGLKVICGPSIDVSREAQDARDEHLLRVVEAPDDLASGAIDLLDKPDDSSVKNFVRHRSGTVDKILDFVLADRVAPRS
ncbi:MAG: hypothetical protein KDB65_05505 [Calditrichaeota bacterium]|nr:hypothetical protein [Calditrichota bacterium]MCB9368107.1 hypothetical protein [Calditrichota bacterium]